MSEPSQDDLLKWLDEAAKYFEMRDTRGEDRAHWANVYNAEMCRKLKQALGGRALFQQCDFISAAGLPLTWKIECDQLSEADWRTIAMVGAKALPAFREAIGVPRGGVKLSGFLNEYATPEADRVLIVDDVWTTGKSLTEFAREHATGEWRGFVAFARGSLPPHVTGFMQLIAPGGPAQCKSEERS
jgi:hypothetical protein